MRALWTGLVVVGSIGLVAGGAGRLPEAVSRQRASRRLHAALAPSAPAPSRSVSARSAPSALGAPFGAGWIVEWARGSRILSRWRRMVGGADTRADRSVPLLLEAVARELRSGASLSAALLVAASGPDLDRGGTSSASALASALRRGVSVADAVSAWVGDDPSASRDLAGTALLVASQTGGATALVIDGVADTLRDRIALEREIAALSSQARASALLLVVAPIVVAALAAWGDPRIAGFLLGSPAGWACIVLGVLLDVVGAAWIHLTIRSTS